MASVMNGVLEFLGDIGIFDVLLPFIMVYVMVFALLERTMIFGYETYEGAKVPKKNLNSLFAFAVAFFALLSSKVVSTFHRAIGPVMLLLLVIVFFITLVSVFKKDEGMHEFGTTQVMIFSIVVLICIILIFLYAIPTTGGSNWLYEGWEYVSRRTNSGFVGAVILLLAMGGFVFWIGYKPKKSDK